MVDGYTKLFSSIIHSTVWQEAPHVKIVWVTMLAMSDQYGDVLASVPGLAKAAGVSLSQCEEALSKFLSPDPYSRTKDNEGRRIEVCDGGWTLLNHSKYRSMRSAEDMKSKNAERQKRYRERNAALRNVTSDESLRMSRQAEAEAEAEEISTTPLPPEGGKRKRRTRNEILMEYSEDVIHVANAAMDEWPAKDQAGRTINCNVDLTASNVTTILTEHKQITPEHLIEGFRAYLATEPKYLKAPQFFFGPGKQGEGEPTWIVYARSVHKRVVCQ